MCVQLPGAVVSCSTLFGVNYRSYLPNLTKICEQFLIEVFN